MSSLSLFFCLSDFLPLALFSLIPTLISLQRPVTESSPRSPYFWIRCHQSAPLLSHNPCHSAFLTICWASPSGPPTSISNWTHIILNQCTPAPGFLRALTSLYLSRDQNFGVTHSVLPISHMQLGHKFLESLSHLPTSSLLFPLLCGASHVQLSKCHLYLDVSQSTKLNMSKIILWVHYSCVPGSLLPGFLISINDFTLHQLLNWSSWISFYFLRATSLWGISGGPRLMFSPSTPPWLWIVQILRYFLPVAYCCCPETSPYHPSHPGPFPRITWTLS